MLLSLLLFLFGCGVGGGVNSYSKPVCHCWTRECRFCQDPRCGVKFNLNEGEVQLSSKLTRRSYTTLVLFDSAGSELGRLMFKVGRLILTGCVQMLTHDRLPKHVWKRGETTDWTVDMKHGNVTVRVGDWEQSEELVGECAEWYSDVAYFAFQHPAECKSAALGGAHFTSYDDMVITKEYYINCLRICR